jgi:hypothetical protein
MPSVDRRPSRAWLGVGFLGLVVGTVVIATVLSRLFVGWSRPVWGRELDWLPLALLVAMLLGTRGWRRRPSS